MTRKNTESIIDIINQFAKDATEIIEEPLEVPEKFSRLKHYLGHYCEDSEQRELILDNETLDNCKKFIKSSSDGYFTTIEFYDIDIEPIQELAEQLEEQDCKSEAALIWNVYDFVMEIQQWTNQRASNTPEQAFERPVQKIMDNVGISHEEFLALFDLKKTNQHRATLLLNHIKEVSKEKNVHTYYGALVQECTPWFKYNEQDFSNLLRKFLDVSRLDSSLSQNVRKTKLGQIVKQRAKEKITEITSSRHRI